MANYAIALSILVLAIAHFLKGRNMSAITDGLNAALEKAKVETTVIGSVQVFVQGLKDQVASLTDQLAKLGATPEQLALVQELNDTLDANAAGLAVVTNTPAATTDTPPANP